MDFNFRALSRRGCDLARTANLRGALLDVFQSPVTGLSISFLEIESLSVIGNGERQGTGAVVQSDAELARLSVPIGIIDRLLSDAQQFFLDLRRTWMRMARDSDAATRIGCRPGSFGKLAQSLLQPLNLERGRA